MPDELNHSTPDRLKQFRAENEAAIARRNRSRAMLLRAAIFLPIALVVAWAIQVAVRDQVVQSTSNSGGLEADQLKAYAVYLEDKQLPLQAMHVYRQYLDRAILSDDARAKVCYRVAKLGIEIEQYEDALAYLYQAEMLAPECEVKQDIDKKIVLCLDKLGRASALNRELRTRAGVRRTATDVGAEEIILAEFGGEVITDRDLEREIERLPASVRASVDTPEEKSRFLRNFVAERLLVDKALELNLDKDAAIQEQLQAERDSLIVRKLIGQQIQQDIVISPEEVKRFYAENPDRFRAADGQPLAFDRVRDRATDMLRASREQQRVQAVIDETLKERDAKIYADRIHQAQESQG